MKKIKKVFNTIILSAVLAAFLLSTSGFVVTRHVCSHHETQLQVIISETDCCSVEETVEKTDCCQSKVCNVKKEDTECCRYDKAYIKLTETFIQSKEADSEKDIKLPIAEKKETETSTDTVKSIKKENTRADDTDPPAVEKKFILYNQIKIEPPLI